MNHVPDPIEPTSAYAKPARPVWTVGLLGGALAGLITCQVAGLILRYYAIARLPDESDAGHRFSVNVEVLGIAGGLLFGSLMITLLIAMRLS
jgi:hypothetical protein